MTADAESLAPDQPAGLSRRRALGDFLRSVRARVTPASVGLPAGLRRRTPGLRREEVAQLAGISITWYTWIEQGRDVAVSAQVWARLANVLHMTRAERHYLFELAECADPDHAREAPGELPEGLQACVDSIIVPAYIIDRAWMMLASNAPLRRLFRGWPGHEPEPNLLRYLFIDPAALDLVVDWETRARRVVAEFRADTVAHTDDPQISQLIDLLRSSSPTFEHWWTRQTVVEREGGRRGFHHPDSGRVFYRQMTFSLAVRPDCKLVMLMEDAS